MSLFKKPSELEIRPTFKALIYGEPGIGKSTLALSAPNPVVFDFDGGITRVNAAHQCPTLQIGDVKDANGKVTKLAWEVVQEAIQELKNDGAEFKTIVIDTAGKMLDRMGDYIIRTDRSPKHLMSKADGTLSLQGFGVRKNMFIQFLKDCALLGKHVIFVAHAKEDRKKKDNEDFIYVRPDIGGSSVNDLIKELDLVGYARAYGFKRTITWNPSDEFYAKNACNLQPNMEIAPIIDANGIPVGDNIMMTSIFDNYTAYLASQRDVRKKFDALMSHINALIDGISDAEGANKALAELSNENSKSNAVWDSQLRASQLLRDKCAALGLKFNKETRKYEAA